MKRTLPYVLLLCLMLSFAAHAADVNRVVLRVNDRIATLVDYQLRKADRMRAIQGSDLPSSRKAALLGDAGKSTLRDMFDELLLLSRADQLGLQVPDAEVDQAIEQTKHNVGITSDEQFQQALAQQGMTEPEYREQVSRNLRMNMVIGREVRSKIQLDEDTLRHYYREHLKDFEKPEAVHLQEVILLDQSGKTVAERQEIGRKIKTEVAAGRKLEDAVKPYVNPGVASGVIDLGWVLKGDLDAALESAAWSLKPGEVTDPISGRGGLHVIQLIERREAKVTPFEDVRGQIESREGSRLFQKAMSDFIKKLENQAYVVADPPPEAVGFREYGATVPPDLAAAVNSTPAREDAAERTTEAASTPSGTEPSTGPADAPTPPPPPSPDN